SCPAAGGARRARPAHHSLCLAENVVKPGDDLIALAAVFAVISLMAFGGVNAVLPEVHRQAVDIHAWVSNDGFTELYALSQAAPGPNMMIVTLIGWQVGGVLGAFVATVA